ncbi:uncharacterized protein [Hyperolius riggenbachi]|uniref:uncharacterized protein isoform X4 n=1 Tax=Hyperolius riggenbachi TaxID=752182 RepID=UPI0035A2AC8F
MGNPLGKFGKDKSKSTNDLLENDTTTTNALSNGKSYSTENILANEPKTNNKLAEPKSGKNATNLSEPQGAFQQPSGKPDSSKLPPTRPPRPSKQPQQPTDSSVSNAQAAVSNTVSATDSVDKTGQPNVPTISNKRMLILSWEEDLTPANMAAYLNRSTVKDGSYVVLSRPIEDSEWKSAVDKSSIVLFYCCPKSENPLYKMERYLDYCIGKKGSEKVIVLFGDTDNLEQDWMTKWEQSPFYQSVKEVRISRAELDWVTRKEILQAMVNKVKEIKKCLTIHKDTQSSSSTSPQEKSYGRKSKKQKENLKNGKQGHKKDPNKKNQKQDKTGKAEENEVKSHDDTRQVMGLLSWSAEVESKWLRELLQSSFFQDVVGDVQHINANDHETIIEKISKTTSLMFYFTKESLSTFSSQPNIYEKSFSNDEKRKIVVVDNLDGENSENKVRDLYKNSSIQSPSTDFFMFRKEEKDTDYLAHIIQDTEYATEKDEKWKKFQHMIGERIKHDDPPCQKLGIVGIFSRSAQIDYAWLEPMLRSDKFQISVDKTRSFYISNNGIKEFYEEVPRCDFGILYHTKNRGRVNISDVTDSLYDHELEFLSTTLGRCNVLVIADDLQNNSLQEKMRILVTQPSIRKHARNLLLVTEEEKKDEEKEKLMTRLQDILSSPAIPATEVPLYFRQKLQSAEENEGTTATFFCELSSERDAVSWKKDGKQLMAGTKHEIQAKDCRVELLVHHLQQEDAGTYTCEIGKLKSSATLKVKEVLQSAEEEKGTTATLFCEKDGVSLKKDGKQLMDSTKHSMEAKDHLVEFLVHNLQQEDDGKYTCETRELESSATLTVKGKDKPPASPTKPTAPDLNPQEKRSATPTTTNTLPSLSPLASPTQKTALDLKPQEELPTTPIRKDKPPASPTKPTAPGLNPQEKRSATPTRKDTPPASPNQPTAPGLNPQEQRSATPTKKDKPPAPPNQPTASDQNPQEQRPVTPKTTNTLPSLFPLASPTQKTAMDLKPQEELPTTPIRKDTPPASLNQPTAPDQNPQEQRPVTPTKKDKPPAPPNQPTASDQNPQEQRPVTPKTTNTLPSLFPLASPTQKTALDLKPQEELPTTPIRKDTPPAPPNQPTASDQNPQEQRPVTPKSGIMEGTTDKKEKQGREVKEESEENEVENQKGERDKMKKELGANKTGNEEHRKQQKSTENSKAKKNKYKWKGKEMKGGIMEGTTEKKEKQGREVKEESEENEVENQKGERDKMKKELRAKKTGNKEHRKQQKSTENSKEKKNKYKWKGKEMKGGHMRNPFRMLTRKNKIDINKKKHQKDPKKGKQSTEYDETKQEGRSKEETSTLSGSTQF